MKNFRKKFILFTVLLIIGGARVSQATEPSEKILQLESLIEEALNNNPLTKASKQEEKSYGAKIGPSGSYEDPVLSFEAKDYPVTTMSRRQYGMTGNEVSLSQKVPFPGKLSKLKNAASYEHQAKKELFNQKQLEIIKNVKTAYYELYLSYKKYDILLEQKNLVKQLIVVIRNKYTLGKISQAELLSFQTEEANIFNQLLLNEKEIRVRTDTLNYILGRTSHALSGRPEEIKKTQINLSKLTKSLVEQKVLQKNPALKATHAELEAAKEKVSYAKRGYLPDFELMGAYTFREPSPGDAGVDFVSGRVGITLPIWALTKQSEEVKGAKAEMAMKNALLEEGQNSLLRMTHSIHAEISEASQRLLLYETSLLPLAKQAVRSGKSAYLTNKIEYLSLINLINNRFNIEYAYHEGLVTYELKIAELEALLGEQIGGFHYE